MVRRSKKKRSSREDYPMHEQLKIEEGVFEPKMMPRLGKLFNKKIISGLEFITARGKEADVYIAGGGANVDEKYVILKIFRLETSSFQKRTNYVSGDPRFGKIKKSPFAVVNEWCKKEYGNLMVAEAAGVHAPRPYAFSGNILALELIGEGGKPSSRMRDVKLKRPDGVLDAIIEDVKRLYSHELVHSDLSEYNILIKEESKEEVPYMIDFGQAILLEHPEAMNYLKRDIHNLLAYFARTYGIKKSEEETFAYVTDQESMKKS
ncbi:RIO-type serine/threonine-protein kinase Rio1 [uncultured archaeon]|nr:RIO-type serine/threonine-protein kinase Rio1 [uncultured archaeon]